MKFKTKTNFDQKVTLVLLALAALLLLVVGLRFHKPGKPARIIYEVKK